MARKDTKNALMKRGINDEVATVLVSKYSSLSDIASAGADALAEIGVDAAVAAELIAIIGTTSRSRSTKPRAVKAEAETEAVPAPAAPTEEYSNPHQYTEMELKLLAMQKELGVDLPKKVVFDMADRVSGANLDDAILEKLLVRASEMYGSHKMCQNESAGVMAAHSIGEPGTQMNLRTFHFAGVASISVTSGLPRLIEIVDARREPSTPSMNIPLKGLAREDKSIAQHVATDIEITTLLDVADIETDTTNLRLLIKPDPQKMDRRGVVVSDIVDKLNKIKAVRGMVKVGATFEGKGDDVASNIVVSSEPGIVTPFSKLQEMYDAIKNARLKGVEGIKRAIIQPNPNTGEISIITEGSNLREILQVEGVDIDNVMTNSIIEVADVFGIEAARNSIIHEATATLENAGLNVDVRHIMLVADLMTNDGTVRAIGRNGVSGKKSSVLARAAFEITAAHLLHAAMVGEVDKLEGVTENIIVGQPVTLGTGAVKLIYNPNKN